MKTREEKGMVKFETSFKTALLGHISKKSTHSLFGAWSFLLVHICFTPNEGPKGIVN